MYMFSFIFSALSYFLVEYYYLSLDLFLFFAHHQPLNTKTDLERHLATTVPSILLSGGEARASGRRYMYHLNII